jgi:hypothetical protein
MLILLSLFPRQGCSGIQYSRSFDAAKRLNQKEMLVDKNELADFPGKWGQSQEKRSGT